MCSQFLSETSPLIKNNLQTLIHGSSITNSEDQKAKSILKIYPITLLLKKTLDMFMQILKPLNVKLIEMI